MTNNVLLECCDIKKSFGGLCALNGIRLKISDKELVGIIGPNGAGKTTLFNVISGLMKPDSGTVKMSGKVISSLKPYQICRLGIARTFQTVRPFMDFTALQNFEIGYRFSGSERYADRNTFGKKNSEIFEFLGIQKKSGILTRNLNLVERKKIELARALASNPRLVLLDEILAGLSGADLEGVLNIIRRTCREYHVSILWIEHLMKPLMRTCDRIIVLQMGEKIADGPPAEILRNPQVVESYLGKKAR